MTTLIPTTNKTQNPEGKLMEVAMQLQKHYLIEKGQHYSLKTLQQALTVWLSSSQEQLIDEALFHLLHGDRSLAFNRHAFQEALERIS